MCQRTLKPKGLQIFRNRTVQPARLFLLLPPLVCQLRHFLLERDAVIGLRLSADVAAGGEDMAVFADLFEAGALAEAGGVGVGVEAL